jgi:hypothetical protein
MPPPRIPLPSDPIPLMPSGKKEAPPALFSSWGDLPDEFNFMRHLIYPGQPMHYDPGYFSPPPTPLQPPKKLYNVEDEKSQPRT